MIYIKLPEDQLYQEIARTNFCKENLTSFPITFPIKDFGCGTDVINNYYDATHIALNTNLLNKQINKKLKDKFTNKFVFEVNPKNMCELQLLSIGNDNFLKKVIANIKFTISQCIINWEIENCTVSINYIDKYNNSDNFWKRFIDIFVSTL